MREAAFRGQARAYYDITSEAERAELRRCRDRLERDPTPDGSTTFAVPGTPDYFLYDDRTWQMYYRTPDAASIVILSLSHALDLPD